MATTEKFTLTRGQDVIEVTILEDGTVRRDIKGAISSVNHGSADSFERELALVLGGETKIERQGKAHHAHTHAEGHGHTH